jgi:hypothetical protein
VRSRRRTQKPVSEKRLVKNANKKIKPDLETEEGLQFKPPLGVLLTVWVTHGLFFLGSALIPLGCQPVAMPSLKNTFLKSGHPRFAALFPRYAYYCLTSFNSADDKHVIHGFCVIAEPSFLVWVPTVVALRAFKGRPKGVAQ